MSSLLFFFWEKKKVAKKENRYLQFVIEKGVF